VEVFVFPGPITRSMFPHRQNCRPRPHAYTSLPSSAQATQGFHP
jgi:hypothetical protein